jgi:hypothetical protein
LPESRILDEDGPIGKGELSTGFKKVSRMKRKVGSSAVLLDRKVLGSKLTQINSFNPLAGKGAAKVHHPGRSGQAAGGWHNLRVRQLVD